MVEKHVWKAFDRDLEEIGRMVLEMGGIVARAENCALADCIGGSPEAALVAEVKQAGAAEGGVDGLLHGSHVGGGAGLRIGGVLP